MDRSTDCENLTLEDVMSEFESNDGVKCTDEELQREIDGCEALMPEEVQQALRGLKIEPAKTISAVRNLIDEWRRRRSLHLLVRLAYVTAVRSLGLAWKRLTTPARPWQVGRAAWRWDEALVGC